MKIDINLLGRKKRDSKAKSIFTFAALLIVGLFVTYFLVMTVYVVYKLTSLKRKLASVNKETVVVSEEIRSKNDLVTKYVLVKGILDQFNALQMSKFRYKDYMDQIVKVLPAEVVLKNVDFSVKGWVSVSVSVPNYVKFEEFEDMLFAKGTFSETWFDSVFVEGVNRDKSGAYTVKMQFAIRKNA